MFRILATRWYEVDLLSQSSIQAGSGFLWVSVQCGRRSSLTFPRVIVAVVEGVPQKTIDDVDPSLSRIYIYIYICICIHTCNYVYRDIDI